MQGGQHAGVGAPEIAEVVVGRVLAAEDGVGASHLGLDKGVTDAGADGRTAVLGHDLGHRAGGDEVVDDRRARNPGQLAHGNECGHGRRRQRLALLVDDEAAVGVTVEGQPDVGLLGHHPGLQVDQVGGLEGVGLVVGEAAVELEVHRHEVDREAGEDRRHRVAAHAVARVDDHPQATVGADVDQTAQVVGVRREHVAPGALPLPYAVSSIVRDALLGQVPDLDQAAVLADRSGAGAAELDAVVGGRVVAGGEHGARQVEAAAGEVELVGGGQTDVDNVSALAGGSRGEGRDELGRGRTHVVADHDGRHVVTSRGEHPDERCAQGLGHLGVELLGDHPPDIVSLDEGREVLAKRGRHGPGVYRGRAAPPVGGRGSDLARAVQHLGDGKRAGLRVIGPGAVLAAVARGELHR